ncbi:hypothetical protein CL617_01065 [archaeon]|nr:hypothetical protein [archaeon]|tara:strand:- start:424 stop:807 length:384 start_codon:yes stop_codon:yes gene_type:complete
MGSIEDYVESLPSERKDIGSWNDARKIYLKSSDLNDFQRIELEGAYGLSRIGIKMIYVIGTGEIVAGGEDVNSLFYFSTHVTMDFFEGDKRNADKIDAIPLDRIDEITLLKKVPESTYSRSCEEDKV